MSNLELLERAGVAVSDLTDEQKAVFAELSDGEVGLLTSIKERLDAASGDVEAHMVVGGVLF